MPQHALETLARSGDETQWGSRGLYLFGEALRGLERHQEALLYLARAAQVAPGNIHVWIAMGWCYKRTGRIDLAIEALEQARRAEPAEPLIHYNLACYLSLAGKKRRALTHLSEALSIDPHFRALIDDETDFDPLRSDPDFQALTSIIV